MEHTNNDNDEARRRPSGGHGLRDVRIKRLRGSMAARSGVTTRGRRGGRGDRPSVSEPLFCDILENLSEVQPLETAMHPKRMRVLPAARPINASSESLWSSLEMITPSTPSTSCVRKTPPPMPAATPPPMPAATPPPMPAATPPPMPAASPPPMPAASPPPMPDAEPIDLVPSPALYLECNMDSGASTPNSTPSVRSRVCNRLSNIRRPLRDDEISTLLNYGSEEESGEEEEEFREGIIRSVVVPRTARIFMEEEKEQDEIIGEGCININLEWPPQPPRPSICDPTPANVVVPRTARMFMEEEKEQDEIIEEGCININLEWPPQPPRPSICDPTPALSSPASPVPDMRISMEPSEKFKFDWRAFPAPQIEPRLRREPFSQNTGPTVSFTNPYEAFTAIWDREIMEVIVRETNIYAQQLTTIMLEDGTICPKSRLTRWQDTNVNEIYTYFAIVLAMGVVVKTRLEEYWNTSKDIFSTPGFSNIMKIDRFLLLSKCLHFNNNLYCNPALLTRPQAKLFKLQPILDHLNAKFSQLYNLSQNVALDESLTMWKGWLDINQFIHNKAATVGIKTYEICESQTGYLWRFEVHAGHDTSAVQNDDPVSGIAPALVLRLLNGLEHKGHTIWMDNFYNSPALARELKIRGFDCVGTLRTNRQFVPSELATITKKDMTVGQVMGCTSGDVDVILWRDKNRVAFISTYHGVATTRCGNTLKPIIVQDYNVCMGGVDRKDQQLAMYPIERRRTRVWYKKIFKQLLNVSVLNAYLYFT